MVLVQTRKGGKMKKYTTSFLALMGLFIFALTFSVLHAFATELKDLRPTHPLKRAGLTTNNKPLSPELARVFFPDQHSRGRSPASVASGKVVFEENNAIVRPDVSGAEAIARTDTVTLPLHSNYRPQTTVIQGERATMVMGGACRDSKGSIFTSDQRDYGNCLETRANNAADAYSANQRWIGLGITFR
jgi:hypothetical protein